MSNSSFFAAPPPAVAIEIARGRVSGAVVASSGQKLAVTAYASEAMPAEAVEPSLNAGNIPSPTIVAEALSRLFDRLGTRPRRLALAIPDSVAKVSLLRFDKVPSRPADLEELIRWQVRKAAPFRMEDAQLTYVPGARIDGGTEFIVVIARRDIVREYEAVCEAAGAQAGIVDLSTFNVINAVLAGPQTPAGDWLLVHSSDQEATMAIMRGRDLVFFRSRAAEGEGGLTDMVHQTAMYYEDRLGGGGFTRVLLAGTAMPAGSRSNADQLRHALEQRLGSTVDAVDPRHAAALQDRITPSAESLELLTPLVGLLARERAA